MGVRIKHTFQPYSLELKGYKLWRRSV